MPLPHPRRRTGGFSLLEVLVAFVILGLALGTLMAIFSGGLRQVSRAAQYQQAILLGQSKLAAIGIEQALEEGDSSGEFAPPYRWQTSIRALPDSQLGNPQEGSDSAAPALMPVTLLEIDVRVLWGDKQSADASGSVTLKTVRLADKVKR